MLMLALDGEGPLHRQVYAALRTAILGGRLAPGTRLASSRSLARELELSRNTVLHAYEQLIAEGYVETRDGSGTFVAESLPVAGPPPGTGSRERTAKADALPLSGTGDRILRQMPRGGFRWNLPRDPVRYDFRYGEPAYPDLPLETWSRLLGRRARRLSVRRLSYSEPGGAPELREALADYLARARGVVCEPDRLMIVQGSQQGIDLCVRLLVDPGDDAVLEEPGYTGFRFCLAAAGARLHPVRVDDDGMRVEDLSNVPSARLACVTPSHQFPAGAVLSLPRRLQLLEWARQSDAVVLEDDYDGEFRYEGTPLSCLQSLDTHGRVVYLGTASKVLFPALRIGWVVLPPGLAEAFRSAKAISDTGTASLEQLAFGDFVREGHLERHVRRIRRRHAARRAVLIESVEAELGERAEIVGSRAGVHVLMRLPELRARDATRLRVACRERDVGVYPAAPFYARPPAHAELLLGYASLAEDDIRTGIRRLREALDAVG